MNIARSYKSILGVLIVFCLGWNNQLLAQQHHKANHAKKKKSYYPAKNSITSSSVTVEGKTIKYKAIAGTIPLFNSDRDTTAHIFFAGYFKKGVKDTSQRPITFLYNGGPGSA